ncbi:maltose acetyltransferase domain-containing protein [Bacillus mycoides]|uniref:maltose acetyltransferase domain-containing protein n=1 Tax=Bacillus mycoides TaxID=1405 RepID=UPI000B44B3CE
MHLRAIFCGFDNELVTAREPAKKLTRLYNVTTDTDRDYRDMLLTKSFRKCGLNTLVEPNCRCESAYNIGVGDNFFANFDCIILDCGKVTIGNNVWLGPKVTNFCCKSCKIPPARLKGYEIAAPINIADIV